VFAIISISILSVLLPYLVKYIAPGVTDAGQISNIILYSRLLLLQPLLLGISNLFGSYTQMKKRFIIYALSPLVYNISIVASIVFIYPKLGMLGVIYGVIIGAVLHACIQIPFIKRMNFLPRIRRIYTHDFYIVKEVLTHSIPRALILSLVQVEFLIMNSVASLQKVGSTATLNLANNLQSVPMSLIGVSFVVASFPILSKSFAEKDEKRFWHTYKETSRKILLYTTIATVFLWFTREYVVSILLGNTSPKLSLAFGLFILSLIPQCIELLITRVYYARGETKKAAFLNIWAAIITITLVCMFGTTVPRIALMFSIGSWLSCAMFWVSIARYKERLRK
jgi:putative peptidoglycan lipid II flippase